MHKVLDAYFAAKQNVSYHFYNNIKGSYSQCAKEEQLESESDIVVISVEH